MNLLADEDWNNFQIHGLTADSTANKSSGGSLTQSPHYFNFLRENFVFLITAVAHVPPPTAQRTEDHIVYSISSCSSCQL